MDTVREQNIQSTINAVENGSSLRQAARLYGILRATLSDCLYGRTSVPAGKVEARKLSPVQERFLTN